MAAAAAAARDEALAVAASLAAQVLDEALAVAKAAEREESVATWCRKVSDAEARRLASLASSLEKGDWDSALAVAVTAAEVKAAWALRGVTGSDDEQEAARLRWLAHYLERRDVSGVRAMAATADDEVCARALEDELLREERSLCGFLRRCLHARTYPTAPRAAAHGSGDGKELD